MKFECSSAVLVLGIIVSGCGSDYSNQYWQDPRDDFSFQEWEEPSPGETPNVMPTPCKEACSEVEGCWDQDERLSDNEKQMTSFPIPKGKCGTLCSEGLLKDSVWQCLADTLQKETNPNYCKNKDLCFNK